jgi:DNA-binding transcriptional ArsR family regulator
MMSCAAMPQRAKSSPADRVFAALSNPTRRDVLDLLLEGPRPVQEIAERFDMARPSVSEHLKVLRDAGLVSETKHGRQRLYAVEPDPLRDLQQWLAPYERFWRSKLAGLGELLDSRHPDEP